jgi:hypothetical protein
MPRFPVRTSWFPLRYAPLLLVCLLLVSPALAATTGLHIVHYARDGTTLLAEKNVTAAWMEANLPVYGDGTTHYYHQGPVFVDDPDPVKEQELRWNSAEDTNVQEKDMGAVKGTALRDLCDLVGGMSPGEMVRLKAEDGFTKDFGYRNIYLPTARQGPVVLTWWLAGEGMVPDYREGMRIVFLADNSTNPWGLHAFGNSDWRASADGRFWYYYRQGEERYPTTTGLSVKYVSELAILPDPGAAAPAASPPAEAALDPSPGIIAVVIAGCVLAAGRRAP